MNTQSKTPTRLLLVVACAMLMTVFTVHASYQSTVLGDTPLAYYPLSLTVDPTGATATDLSGNGNSGTYNGSSPEYNTVAGPSAYIPEALQFDGASSFVDLSTGGNTSILNFAGQITLEAWVQPANSTSFGDIFAKGYDSSTSQEIALRVNGPYGANYFGTSGSAAVSGGQQNNNWTHVVLANNGTTTSLYINGVLAQSTADTTGAVTFGDSWAIGNGTSSGASRLFNGNICQVALYNYGLSANSVYTHFFIGKYGVAPTNAIPIITNQPTAQVSYTNGTAVFSVGVLSAAPLTNLWFKNGSPLTGQTNLTLTLSNLQSGDIASYSLRSGNGNGITNSAAVALSLVGLKAYNNLVVADGPLAYYPLDSNIDTGSVAADFSGNGNFGTYINVDPVGNNIAGPSATIPNAVNFNGYSSMVDLSVGNHPSLLNFSGPIALEAWVLPADSTSFGDVMAKGYDANSYQETVIRVNGPYGANYYANSASAGVSGGQQNNSWTHVVLSSDGTRCSLYVNGVLAQSVSDTSGSQLFSDAWAIGNGTSAGNNRFFNGAICQVAIYNHGLTTNQVLNHFFLGAYGIAPSNSIPLISSQPQPQSAYAGGTATFSVSVIGTLPTTNLWFKNGSPLVGKTNLTLVLPNVQSGDAANYSVVVGNSIGKTNSASATLTVLSAADSLVWTITNNNSYWDSGGSANWVNISNSQQVVFNTGDQVLFDDVAGVPTDVYLSGTVAPSSIVVNSDNNNFAFKDGGSGALSGSGSLTKKGASTLSILTSDNMTGPVNISGGVVYAGNYAFQSVSSITVTNGSTLDLAGGQLSGAKPVTIGGLGFGGEGALYNSSYEIYSGNVLSITLASDASFGGSSRWDLGNGSSISGAHNLTLNRANSGVYNEWDTVNVANNVGDIELAVGKLGLKNMTTSFGNPSASLIVDGNVELDFWSGGINRSMHVLSNAKVQIFTAPGDFNSPNVVLEDNAQWYTFGGSGNQILGGTYVLNGVAHILVGDANRLYTNVVSGPGGFVVDAYNHQMIFSASNTYAGPTVIGNGPVIALSGNGSISHSSPVFFGGSNPNNVAVDVSARGDQTLTLASGQTLAGIGAINGALVVGSGAILSPAGTNITLGMTMGSSAVGSLSASGNIALNGTTVIKLNGPGTNDVVASSGTINYSGTLDLENISGVPLVAGNSFQVFNATTRTGSFTSVTPATPGAGLAWDLSHLNIGQISVVTASSQPAISTTKVVGGSLVFSGTGGTAGGTYYVLSATNLATPLLNWIILSTNQYDGSGNFSVTNSYGTNVPNQFYLLKQ